MVDLFDEYIPWDTLLRENEIDNDIALRYIDSFSAYNISLYVKMSEDFISKLWSVELDYRVLSLTQELSEKFITKRFSKLDRELISFFQPLSDEFIEKNRPFLSMPLIERSRSMTANERNAIRDAFIDLSRKKLKLESTLDIIKHILSDQFK
ncbi:hypothetical protein D3C74_351700 [compost metagenome]